MGATEDPAIRLDTVANDPALAMNACWRESVDGAFEAVKDMCCSSGSHLERLVVVVPAHLTDRHLTPPPSTGYGPTISASRLETSRTVPSAFSRL
jgi:hypothetical protein